MTNPPFGQYAEQLRAAPGFCLLIFFTSTRREGDHPMASHSRSGQWDGFAVAQMVGSKLLVPDLGYLGTQ